MKNHPSRSIPAITNLLVFDACARYLSFTRAGQALGLSQGAVSRQVIELEQFLGDTLFTRHPRALELTTLGQAYAQRIRPHLAGLEAATRAIQNKDLETNVLRVAASMSLCHQWLVQRLPDFLANHDGITVNLRPDTGERTDRFEDIDIALINRPQPPADVTAEVFLPVKVVPVCAPQLLANRGRVSVSQLPDLPLLHYEEAPLSWLEYVNAAGNAASSVPVRQVNASFVVNIQAALAGLGVALLPQFLVSDDLRDGRLVQVHDFALQTRHAYYLTYPQGGMHSPPVAAFRRWLLSQVAPWRAASAYAAE